MSKKFRIHYDIYLLERVKKFDDLKKSIKLFLTNHSIQDVFTQNGKNKIIISFWMEPNIFESLYETLKKQYNYDLKEYVIVNYAHYHIDRYEDGEELHSVIAYNIKRDIWEFYYQGGVLADRLHSQEGTLENEGIFLFLINTPNNEELDHLESIFDTWLKSTM